MNYYKSINFIPVKNFFLVSETGDLRYLLKDIDYEDLPKIDNLETNLLNNAFSIILSECPENSFDNEILRKKYVIAKLEFEVAAGDLHKQTFLDIEKIKLQDYINIKLTGKSNFYEDIVNIEKVLKIKIDESKCVLRKYFEYKKRAIDIINNSKKADNE